MCLEKRALDLYWLDRGRPKCGGRVSREALVGAVGVAVVRGLPVSGEVEPVEFGWLM